MLGTLLTVASVIYNLLHIVMVASFSCGKAIVFVLYYMGGHIAAIGVGVVSLLRVAVEDFGVFAVDLAEGIWFVVNAVVSAVELLFGGVFSINSGLKYLWNMAAEVVSSIGWFGHKVTACIGHIVVGVKYFFVLLGSGVWFAVTLVPVTVFYAWILCTYYVGRLFEEIGGVVAAAWSESRALASNFRQFFADVPLEATLGLIFTACIVYVLSRSYVAVLAYACRKLAVARRCVADGVGKVGRALKRKEATVKTKRRGLEEVNSCVVCQDREKCVVVLPCKHLCMCSDCSRNIYQCPMCRSEVERTMKVFV